MIFFREKCEDMKFFLKIYKISVIRKKKLGKERQLMTIVKGISQQYKERDDSFEKF